MFASVVQTFMSSLLPSGSEAGVTPRGDALFVAPVDGPVVARSVIPHRPRRRFGTGLLSAPCHTTFVDFPLSRTHGATVAASGNQGREGDPGRASCGWRQGHGPNRLRPPSSVSSGVYRARVCSQM